jgi:hypothetical protein
VAAGEILKARELPKHSDESMDTFGRPQYLGLSAAGLEKTECSVRHSQRKRGATARLHLRSIAPALDPTRD